MAKSALLLDAVKEAEGWTTDDQDYQQILNDEAANANMSQEDFLKAANDYYGEDTVVRNIMMERMINMVLDNASGQYCDCGCRRKYSRIKREITPQDKNFCFPG